LQQERYTQLWASCNVWRLEDSTIMQSWKFFILEDKEVSRKPGRLR
jgi:hypothetical protein